MVLAITSLLRAQQPVLGLDALQLQCAVGIPHDLRFGAPLQRDGTNRRLGVAMSRWISLLHRRAGQERVVMSTALLGEPGRFKFKKTNTTLAHYTIQEGSCLPARTVVESSSTLGSEYYKTGALQQWTLVQTE